MAGDWIKMRTDLYRDPKVCVIAELLMDTDGDLCRYVNQHCRRDMTVTRNVTRCATVGALVAVWGVMRHRGKRVGDDLCCAGVTVNVIDDIADLQGFGEAMEHVGWVVQTDDGVTFPRFFGEYNADPSEKTRSSAAQRQARYRASRVTSRVAQHGRNATVTRDVTVAPREEKRREEKKEHSLSENVCDKPKKRGFVPPTVEEVRAYCVERANGVDPERFVDHYTARGWIMTNGRKVQDWQACVRTWEKNDGRSTGGGAGGLFPSPGGAPRSREEQREAANHGAIAAFLNGSGIRQGDAGADNAQADRRLHAGATPRLVFGAETVPAERAERGGGGTGNVRDAVPGIGGPVSAVPVVDAQGVQPDGW